MEKNEVLRWKQHGHSSPISSDYDNQQTQENYGLQYFSVKNYLDLKTKLSAIANHTCYWLGGPFASFVAKTLKIQY